MTIMWQRKDSSMNPPVVEVTASTPLKAQFDDSNCRKDESSIYEASIDDEEGSFDPPKESKLQRLRTLLYHNSKPVPRGRLTRLLIFKGEPLPDHSDIYFGKTDWRSIINLLLAIYATLFSAISLAIAIWRPRYGKFISPTGSLIPSTADLLFSLFAKSIEIVSSGVYINFLGQFFTRRSLRSRGISLADIAVREWLVQPGFVIFEWGNLKYAATTALGFFSLLAAIAIYFFTTASNSLVSPHLALGNWESTQFFGQVQQNFGNVLVLKKDCWAPTDSLLDGQDIGESCVNVLASGLASQDFNNYMKAWATKAMNDGGNATTDFSNRPMASSSIFTDTKTTGNWIPSTSSMSDNFVKYGRVVNNITLSMPHPVVYYSAAVEFPQLIKGTGFGEHSLTASVVSPTSNTLCVNMQKSEVAPLVYVEWPNARFNTSTTGNKIAADDWTVDVPANTSLSANITQTNVGAIFKWGSLYNRKPPVFQQVSHTRLSILIVFADFESVANRLQFYN